MVSTIWDLEVLIDQYTWIPWITETMRVTEMKWLNFITVFPEPIALGEMLFKPIRTRGPMKKNYMVVEERIAAQDYLSAIQKVFQETQRVLDLLSIVTSRGFKIYRVRPSAEVRQNLGLIPRENLKEKIRSWLLRKLLPEPVMIDTFECHDAESLRTLTAYKELVAVMKSEGYLQENVRFTTDFPGKGYADVRVEMLRKEGFGRRLAKAQKNFPKIVAIEEMGSAIRLYRISLQLNDYAVRYILLWTALESATQVPHRKTGKAKINWISSKVTNIPGVPESHVHRTLQKLNRIRNTIVHEPAVALKRDFQESLPKYLVDLEWLLYNHLLSRFGLPMLPATSSPFLIDITEKAPKS